MENQFFDRISEYYSGGKDREELRKEFENDPKAEELFHWIELFWTRLRPGKRNTKNIQKRTNSKLESRPSPDALFRLGAVKYAAGILLALAVGSVTYFFSGDIELVEVTSGVGEIREIELPDGSKVWLNAQSALVYPEEFRGEFRDVTIKGEAYFKVRHDSGHPFVVNSEHVRAKVLGTSFLINDHADEQNSDAYLAEGSIDLEIKELKQTIRLVPGDMLSYNKETLTYERTNNPGLSIDSWRFGKLSFYNESLFEIARELERKFGKRIVIADEYIGNMKFTADFESESLEEILDFFSVGSNLDYRETQNAYILTKK